MDMNTPSAVAGFMAALARTECLPPEHLVAYQHRLLDKLVRHARTETAFYADRLAPLFRRDNTIDWWRWQELPILTRTEAQIHEAALRARSLPSIAGEAAAKTTSGSTGEPFRHVATAMQTFAAACANERFYNWHDIAPGKLSATIWAVDDDTQSTYPDGGPPKQWRIRHNDSRAVDLTIATPVFKQVEWLRRIRPQYLATYPTNLREIGRVAAEEGRPLMFDALLTYGEMLTEETRSHIRSYFGRGPLDRYGSTEVAFIAGACPHSMKHHIAAELVLIEIVDEDGVPAEPGTVGRIVATPFYSLAMPMIRYDTGDYGALSGEPCGCGRTLPRFDRINGRKRNIFRFADGSSIWPVLQSWIVQRFVPHRQFQVLQTALNRIEYRYVPVSPTQQNDIIGLTEYARVQLHPTIIVDAVAVDEIPRPPEGKHEDYISLIA